MLIWTSDENRTYTPAWESFPLQVMPKAMRPMFNCLFFVRVFLGGGLFFILQNARVPRHFA